MNNGIERFKSAVPLSKLVVDEKFRIDPNCKKCYGRGFVGINLTFGHKVACSRCQRKEKLVKVA